MERQTASGFGVIRHSAAPAHESELDLVVPYTTPVLTRQAVAAADRMGAGLNATLRIVRVQLVPFPMELSQSPVHIDFMKTQLAQFHSVLPVVREIRLARELEAGLAGVLTPESLIILATRKRPWKTTVQRTAERLRKAGHKVVLIEVENA
ncbi:MAG: hypothetical protein M3N93_03470 [Acidobacteriota bacterium]|nr:hypothetical protein [Acidobacteriota bacterium]